MKKNVIIVPKDKCPLDVLAEMGKQIKESWIFLHHNAVEKLRNSDGVSSEEGRTRGTLVLTWKATDAYPETKIVINLSALQTDWKPIILISASDIYYDLIPVDPEDILFLRMSE